MQSLSFKQLTNMLVTAYRNRLEVQELPSVPPCQEESLRLFWTPQPKKLSHRNRLH